MHCPNCKKEPLPENLSTEIFDQWPFPIRKIYKCKDCGIFYKSETISYRDEKSKPILCLDFDGVIHSYISGWKGIDTIPDDPVPEAFDKIRQYMKYFKVAIYSSRSKEIAGVDAMQKWFVKNGFTEVEKLYFPIQKPAAYLTIDDRAIQFNGNFPTPMELLAFRPWFKKDEKMYLKDVEYPQVDLTLDELQIDLAMRGLSLLLKKDPGFEYEINKLKDKLLQAFDGQFLI